MNYYKIGYLSSYEKGDCRQRAIYIQDREYYEVEDTVIVRRKNSGIWLGVVLEVYENKDDVLGILEDDCEILTDIDLDFYKNMLATEKRKEELKVQMDEMFAKIDIQRKYEYYASLDDDFKELYNEYKHCDINGGMDND